MTDCNCTHTPCEHQKRDGSRRWLVTEVDVPGSSGDYVYNVLQVHPDSPDPDPELGGEFPREGEEVARASELDDLRTAIEQEVESAQRIATDLEKAGLSGALVARDFAAALTAAWRSTSARTH